jgi:hypothetical protein
VPNSAPHHTVSFASGLGQKPTSFGFRKA